MCGICGIVGSQKNFYNRQGLTNQKIVEKMVASIKHRGPDGQKIKTLDDGRVSLGHCRLAIIDLSEEAAQPMTDSSGRYTVVFNGEIYNYRELRKEIELHYDYCFRTASDTEVLLVAYIKWGTKALNRLNGIFAFAIWDEKEKELILARDRYGTKPLYYTKIQNQVLFSSEYKSFYNHPGFVPKIDICAVKEYFTFQNIFSSRSFLQNVNLLEAGSFLKIKPDMTGSILDPIRYWDFDFTEDDICVSECEYEEELNRLFCQAVKRQLVSDVEVGAYLSGGIDSGGITAIAAKLINDLKSFTCGMDLHSVSGLEHGFDEREMAEHLSYLYGTEHYEIVLKAGDMERCMKDLVWHLEDPRVGQSYPNYYAAKLASNFVKVVLAGTGGDELFGGYPWRYYIAMDSRTIDGYFTEYYGYWQRLLDEQEQEKFFSPIQKEIEEYNTEKVFKSVFGSLDKRAVSPEYNVNNSLYLEAKTFLHGLLLVEDKLSMAFGLEARVPFLDNDLVDFSMHLPVRYKIKKLRNFRVDENSITDKASILSGSNMDGKMLLRKVMARYLPPQMIKAKKQGFSAPDASWFRGESLDYVRDILSNSDAKMYSYLDKGMANKYFDQHIKGEKNNRLLIWSILNFEMWLNLYL